MEELREHNYQHTIPPATAGKHPPQDSFEQHSSVDPFLIYLYRVGFKPTRAQLFKSNNRVEAFSYILQELAQSSLADKEVIESYLRHLYRHMSSPTNIHTTLNDIGSFMNHRKSTCNRSIQELTRAEIESWVEHEQDRGLKPATVRLKLVRLRGFIRFLIEQEQLPAEVLSRRIMIKLPEKLPRAIDPADLQQLLSGIGQVRDRALILLLLRTGMRVGELLHTKLADINRTDKKIFIYQAPKTGSGRVVYYSDDAAYALEAWIAQRATDKTFLFYGHRNRPLSYSAARCIFMNYIQNAGLAHKGYTVHCLRHSFASELLNAGMRLEYLQTLLGHGTIEVTRRYARLTDKTRADEYFKAMHRIERGEVDGHY